MKKLFFSSLFAMLMLMLCQSETVYAQKKIEGQDLYPYQDLKTPPQYPGGVAEFYKTVFKAVKYPEDAAKQKKQGTVVLSFVIEKDGSLSQISADKDLGLGMTEAAIAALKTAKKWTPAQVDGKAVRVKMNVPIKFALKS